jgi:hypothetical protein
VRLVLKEVDMWTMRTLVRTQVLSVAAILTLNGAAFAQKFDTDGAKLITQRHAERGNVTADDAPEFPVTISESGSYRLGSDLIVPDGNTTAIDITVADVNIDLNGFNILSPGGGTGNGVQSGLAAGNVTVRNGGVRGFGGHGLLMGRGVRVDGVIARSNGSGIRVSFGGAVVNSVASLNGTGIDAGPGSTVIGNTVRMNAGVGMVLAVDAGYVHNVVTGNNGGDANPQVTGGIQMGGNVCGSALCP